MWIGDNGTCTCTTVAGTVCKHGKHGLQARLQARLQVRLQARLQARWQARLRACVQSREKRQRPVPTQESATPASRRKYWNIQW